MWLRWDGVDGMVVAKVGMVVAKVGMLWVRWDGVAKMGMDVGKVVWCG